MKKVCAFLLAIVLLLQLSGCGIYEIMTGDTDRINAMSEEIIRCLVEKDRDTLEKLFCQKVRDTAKFEAQMDDLYTFFDYDSFIRYDLDGNHAQSHSTEAGERVEWLVCAEIIYIEVFHEAEDESRFYGITYDWTATYQNDTSLVGLHTLTVFLLNSPEEKTVGTDRYFTFGSSDAGDEL